MWAALKVVSCGNPVTLTTNLTFAAVMVPLASRVGVTVMVTVPLPEPSPPLIWAAVSFAGNKVAVNTPGASVGVLLLLLPQLADATASARIRTPTRIRSSLVVQQPSEKPSRQVEAEVERPGKPALCNLAERRGLTVREVDLERVAADALFDREPVQRLARLVAGHARRDLAHEIGPAMQSQARAEAEHRCVGVDSALGTRVVHPHRHGVKGDVVVEHLARDHHADRRGVVVAEIVRALDAHDARHRHRTLAGLAQRIEAAAELNVAIDIRAEDDGLHVAHRGEAVFEANGRALVHAEQRLEVAREAVGGNVAVEAMSQ